MVSMLMAHATCQEKMDSSFSSRLTTESAVLHHTSSNTAGGDAAHSAHEDSD